MDKEELKRILPHREPMLLVDKAELVNGESVSEYTVKGDEFFLSGHFPGNPITPGVILCEMMAQGSVLLFKDILENHLALYAGLDRLKFRRVVRPGDTLSVRSRILDKRGNFITVEANGTVDGKRCCSGILSFMLEKIH